MKFFVRYALAKYEGETHVSFDTIDEVVALINQHATNPDFTFVVIEGRQVEFEAVDVVKTYRRKV